MAPSGPAPEMVGNETSLSTPVSRRKLSSAATASISVSFSRGASRSSHARKRVSAAPSRACAARAGDQARQRVGGGRLVEAHALAGLAEGGEVAFEIDRFAHVGELFEAM